MWIELLGPLRVVVDGAEVAINGRRRRAALALLALRSGRAVDVDSILDALWADEPPASGRHAVVSLLSRVRTQLGERADCIEHLAGGYRLRPDLVEIDVDAVREWTHRARGLATDDPRRATLLRSALDRWHGEALTEFADIDVLAGHAVSLRELRLTIEDEWLTAAVGVSAGIVGVGDDLVEQTLRAAEEAPLREQRRLAHITALAVRGRTAEALRAGAAFRRLLAEETGLEPSPALTALEQAVANGDLAPTAPPASAPPERSGGPGLDWRASRPSYVTPLHGRSTELTLVAELMRRERLVAIVGPGGVGKTRLLAEVLERIEAATRDAIVYVALAALHDEARPTTADQVAAALAGSIGIRPSRGQSLLDASCEWLEHRRAIVVLDNCEHVLDAVRDVMVGLLELSGVRVLTTSRVPSGLAGECVVRLAPLPRVEGADPDALAEQPAIRLFCERARRVTGREPDDLATVAEIVDRLDGIPLAIELAAARLSTLSLDDLHRRIGQALDLLADGRPTADARQRSLRATFDWSYRLLDAEERRMLAHLAAFADGADLDAVAMIAAALGADGDGIPQVAGLVDASIVLANIGADTRYSMPEALRSFARERHRAHGGGPSPALTFGRWARSTAHDIDIVSRGRDEPRADRRLRSEVGNLRAAHRAARGRGDIGTAAAITISLDRAASFRDLPSVWSLARELADDPALVGDERESAVLGAAAEAAWLNGDLDAAERFATRGLQIEADRRCQYALATVELFRGSFERARELFIEASAEDATALANAALAAVYGGDEQAAADLVESGSSWADRHGAPTDRAIFSYATGELRNPHRDAARSYEHAIELARWSGATFVEGVASVGLASVHAQSGAHRQALEIHHRLVRYWARTGNWTQQWITLDNVAELLRRLGDEAVADAVAEASSAAEHAPEPRPHIARPAGVPTRSDVVDLVLTTIARHLGG